MNEAPEPKPVTPPGAQTPRSVGNGSPPGAGAPVRPPLVLLADDEADVALVAQARLEVNGFEVLTAADGEEALTLIRQRLPDLVLLDLRMPKLDGYQVCQALKSDPDTSDLPIIVFSASGYQYVDHVRKCLELGANDHIRKPYSPEELVTKVRRHIRTQPR